MTGRSPRTAAQDAVLALLLEVTGTPKPGNVDRLHDHDDLRFEHFLAGAVGAEPAFRAVPDAPLGETFRRAIEGMRHQQGGNTQFGAILTVLPLVYADHAGDLSPDGAADVVAATTVEDAVGFYRAFDAVDVAVDDPPEGMDDLDVRRGGDAAAALRERDLTLFEVMERSADVDGVAAEWVDGFPRVFDGAAAIRADDGPVPDRAARVFLEMLATDLDTFVVKTHDHGTAERVRERARAARDGDLTPAELADELVAEGVNPGTTADLTAGALFVALRRGVAV
ncbi:triphosphoribosyl-dephospho-CoA synthase [Haloglomus litoreum]|uniref:triphosphoribosyl-dephospho-CoA synthase n=1 Tax=Haloglomus litoreum TaxID=3034026 RepID=UPI0023E78347|nr:triphosphoribosyl-dephospho-CoA synthase [Haloglomus sp. DT116]